MSDYGIFITYKCESCKGTFELDINDTNENVTKVDDFLVNDGETNRNIFKNKPIAHICEKNKQANPNRIIDATIGLAYIESVKAVLVNM